MRRLVRALPSLFFICFSIIIRADFTFCFVFSGHSASKDIKEHLTRLQREKDILMKSWEENLQLANHQKAYLLMLGESKEIEAWIQDQENLVATNKSPTIAELDKIERNLGEYSKRIQYLKDTSSKLPKVRL